MNNKNDNKQKGKENFCPLEKKGDTEDSVIN